MLVKQRCGHEVNVPASNAWFARKTMCYDCEQIYKRAMAEQRKKFSQSVEKPMVDQPQSVDLSQIIAEGIEDFMASVPGNPSGGERDWSSQDMANVLLALLAKNGGVRLSEDHEMPHITEDIAKLALELVKEGAGVFTAGADGMWEAIKKEGFRRVEPLER